MLNNLSNKNATSIDKKAGSKQTLPELVSQWYYKQGLFISSYPVCALGIVLIVFFISCIPLKNIPLPGTIPTKVILPYENSAEDNNNIETGTNFSVVNDFFNINNITFDPPFPWANSKPYFFVQQIILRAGVFPWQEDLHLTDAFRAPLYEVFKLIEVIRNHEYEGKITLDHLCLHVENIKQSQKENIFPEYNCLILSPANLWGQDIQNFSKDVNILNTIFQYHNLQKAKVSIAEMLFGLPMQDTGFKRYPLRSRSRIVQYAITLILQSNDQGYLDSLKQRLTSLYPLYQSEPKQSSEATINNKPSLMYIYYPGEFKLLEFLPICVALLLLFIYVYFSVRKIEIIKSRVVLALGAVLTALGSLMMSLGLCFFFGLTISLQSKVFPYLVILVGLENCLVITKSVVSTEETFDTKIRIAQGLRKEGWHISKTLLTEITILTVGLATFVPVIQEFCVFAIVGLMSDFFLQMLFFSTILALDIKKIDYEIEAKQIPKMMSYAINDVAKRSSSQYRPFGEVYTNKTFYRSHSHPKLTVQEVIKRQQIDSFKRANGSLHSSKDQKIPKRLKLVNFWARTRFFQRAFMIWMSIWILSIIYSSGFLEDFLVLDDSNGSSQQGSNILRKNYITKKSKSFLMFNILKTDNDDQEKEFDETINFTDQVKKLQFPDFEIGYYLSNFHWSSILKQYNISLSGKYITVLPAIKLSYAVKPDVAILLRNPKEALVQNFEWKALAAALDPLDFSDNENRQSPDLAHGGTPLYPKSPMEIFLATVLCTISVCVLTYTMVVFYRCICTRNYAEWRSSWNESEISQNTEQILEALTVQIDGHKHKIECIASDGEAVVSSCLKGQIKVWDAKSGELLTEIDRNKRLKELKGNVNDTIDSCYRKRKDISPIWCLDYLDNLIAVGCADGQLEFWETPTGILKCAHQENLNKNQGITHIHLFGDRVIVARLSGRLDFYKLETYYKGKQIDWGFTSAYRRTHIRTGSAGSIKLNQDGLRELPKQTKEEMKCTLEYVRIAHQQPITCMEIANGIIFTGSQDHTLKVYNLEEVGYEFTLHGHCGPITCLFVDHWQPGAGGSGSQDGLLCVWDLFTGACMYNIKAHDGSISSLSYAPSYVISLGTDERVCVWERFQGNLLTTINVANSYSSLIMLTPSLLVTSKLGSLIIWDVRSGEPTREVKLNSSNTQLCPKHMILASSLVICDYGNQLRIIRFPMVADKCN